MSFYNFQEFINAFKKRYKMFIFVMILLCSLSILANKTFLKNKLSRNNSIIFDYEFHYSWIKSTKQSVRFDEATYNLLCDKQDLEADGCIELPFQNHQDLHAIFFSSIYRFNLEDLKSNQFQNENYEIAKSFHYDTTNFKYKNRKLHIAWSNVEEAEKYLQSLHDRAKSELLDIIQVVYEANNKRAINNIKTKLLTFPPKNIGERIKKINNLKSDAELEKFVKKNVDTFKTNEIFDIDLIKLTFSKVLFHPNSLVSLQLPYYSSDDQETFQSIFSAKRDMIYYYLGNKYNSNEKINDANLFFFPEILNFIKDFDSYLPTYELIVKKVDKHYIYLIEILLSFLISLIVIFTLIIKDREN